MFMWWLMLAFALLIPLLMMVFGFVFARQAPMEINPLFGYRTTLSMKNMDTWIFAHRHIGASWKKAGAVMLVISVAAMLAMLPFVENENAAAIGGLVLCLAQCVVMILTIFPTERALRAAFHEDGSRKNNGASEKKD